MLRCRASVRWFVCYETHPAENSFIEEMDSSRFKVLYRLLVQLFPGNAQLRNFLLEYPYERAGDIVQTLPDVSVSPLEYKSRALEAIQSHGLDDIAFFDALMAAFPSNRSLIELKRSNYLNREPEFSDPEPSGGTFIEEMPSIMARDSFDLLEKIMGERPSFLDVSFLRIGMLRAMSVVRLRMRFREAWFSGTGFLISSDTILTAHHNLWSHGEKAQTVFVDFDFELGPSGALRQYETVEIDAGTFLGQEAHDWAVLQLSQARADRLPIPLAANGPKIGDRVSIIQHPDGNPKQIALHHNLVTAADTKRVQYLTDTLPGSSGSPVFNETWEVIAMHHKGGYLRDLKSKRPVYRNQGISVDQLYEVLSAIDLQTRSL